MLWLILTVAVAIIACIWNWRRTQAGPHPTLIIACGLGAPFLAAAIILLANGGKSDVRIGVSAVQFEPGLGASVGGSRQDDDLVTEGLPANLVRFQPRDDGGVDLFVSRRGDGDDAGVVSINRSLVGARLGTPGTEMCVAACGQEDASFARIDGDGRSLVTDTLAGPEMLRKPAFDFLPGLSLMDWGPLERVYPLRNYAPIEVDGAPTEAQLEDAASGFLFRERAFNGRLLLIELGAHRERARAGHPDFTIARPHEGCSDDVKLSLMRIRFGERPAEGEWVRGRLREVRSLTARLCADGVLTLALDTPEVVTLRERDIDAARGASVWDPIASLGPTGTPMLGEIRFSVLGERVRNALDRRLRMEGDQPRLVGAGGARETMRGGTEAIGEGRVSVISLDWFGPGWPLGILAACVLIAGALTTLWATWGQQRASWSTWALFALLNWLTTWGVLVGLEAIVFDSASGARRAFVQAIAAFVLAPLILWASSRETRPDWRPFLAQTAFAIVAVVVAWRIAGAGLNAALYIVAAAFVFTGVFEVLRRRGEGAWPPTDIEKSRQAWLVTLTAFVAFRVLCAGIGWSEAITPAPGIRFAHAIWYVPAMAFMCGWLFDLKRRDEDPKYDTFYLVAFFICLGASAATPAIFRDAGAAIYALPFALFALVFALDGPRKDRWFAFCLTFGLGAFAAAGAIMLVVDAPLWAPLLAASVFLILAGYAIWSKATRAFWSVPAAFALVIILITNVAPGFSMPGQVPSLNAGADTSRNTLRVMQAIAPEWVNDLSSRDAAELRAAMTHMADHTRSFDGRGYLNTPERSELRRYHLNDNVSAIHVMSPFGRIGGASFLVMLGGLGVAFAGAALHRRGVTRPDGQGAMTAALLVATIVMTSAYMFAANVQAVPFTGRNVYLLSVASFSDFLEAMALFALARFWAGDTK